MTARTWMLSALLAASACLAESPPEEPPPDTDDPECQIQAEEEKSPGYPFNLDLYANQVLPVVTLTCGTAGCHGPPVGQKNFTVWPAAAPGNCDYAKTFNSLVDFVDLANPTNSALYVAISGANPAHPLTWQPDDERLQTLAGFLQNASDTWIADGNGGTPPPPGASPFDYAVYQDVIQPILDTAADRGCALAGCHGTGAGGFSLIAQPARGSAEMQANFVSVTARTNLNQVASSLVYLQATTRHGAGASAVVSPPQAQALLAWIQTAADNAGGGGGPVTPPTCAPVDRFNAGVFRDEILPILRGDVDLNNPGGGVTTTGCMRGPCHGTDRGPGILFLGDTLDAAQNLANFACFVDLANPSASEVLLCPLDDPRCRKNPHPGQDVFAGANDLNYQKVLAYLYGSRLGATPHDFAFFVRRVNPIFNDLAAVEGGAQGRTCADAVGCHGVAVVGQAPPNGSNFPIIPNAADEGRLTFNFVSAANFVNFLNPEESSLFLYPTNEIADTAERALATGLPHPGGADFAVDSAEARQILRWAGGLRPDGEGFVTDWLVAGDYPAAQITDRTPIDELAGEPAIFDPTGATQFNNGEWDGLFADDALVDLDLAFPRAATPGRVAYAVAYLINTTSFDITAQVTVSSPNALRVYVGSALVAQADGAGGGVSAIAQLPAYAVGRSSTRILIKLFQRADDQDFAFSVQLRDELGNLLTDRTGEVLVVLGPEGGI